MLIEGTIEFTHDEKWRKSSLSVLKSAIKLCRQDLQVCVVYRYDIYLDARLDSFNEIENTDTGVHFGPCKNNYSFRYKMCAVQQLQSKHLNKFFFVFHLHSWCIENTDLHKTKEKKTRAHTQTYRFVLGWYAAWLSINRGSVQA